MKKEIVSFFAVILYFFIIGLMSCGNETENKLTGDWKMTDIHSPKFDTAKMVMQLRLKIINDSLQTSKTTDSEVVKKWKLQAGFMQGEIDSFPLRMKAGMDSTLLRFYQKGTFMSVFYNSRDTGTWQVNEKTNKLVTTGSEGRVDSLTLFSVTDDSMRIGKDSASWMLFKKIKK